MKYLLNLVILALLTVKLPAQNARNLSEVEFVTEDQINISASYLNPQKTDSLSPAIILIHQGGSSRQEWLELSIVDRLTKAGYALLIYDIRLHGKSGKDGDFADLYNNSKRAPLDLLAAIDFLKQDQQIDGNKIGIMGASIGGNLACMASGSDRFGVKSVVVMSAKTEAAQNLSGSQTTLSPQNAFYIASRDEQEGLREKWAHELYKLTQGEKKIKIASGGKHGSYILREDSSLEDDIIQWFRKTL